MTFFYDLNKRLAALADKQDAQQINEEAKATAPQSKLAQALNERDMGKHNNATTGFAALAKKAGKEYGSKVAGERVAGAVKAKMAKAGKLEEGTCPACDCSPCKCESVEESALQAYLGKKKYGDEGMKALQKAGRDHAGKDKMDQIRNRYDKMDEADMEEGNAFTGALAKTPKGGTFKVGGKEFKDTSDLEEGFKEMDAWLASREKEKGTGKFDKKERTLPGGMKATTYTRKHDDEEDDDKDAPEAKGGAPKKKGRPKGKDKGPERVTAKSYKYKSGRPTKTKEDVDVDGVMMTRPTNCSMENIEHGEQGEYNDEAGMTKDSLHTIVRHARELESALRSNENLPEWVQEKVGQIKGMMSSVSDYIISTHERDAEQRTGREGLTTVIPETASFSGGEIQQAYRLAVVLKGLVADPDGKKVAEDLIKLLRYKLQQSNDTLQEKSVSQAQARMMAGAAHNPKFAKKVGVATKVAKEFNKADTGKDISKLPKKVKEGGKPDFLDLDKDGNKTEPMKKAAKDVKAKKSSKEEIDEFFDNQVTVKGGDARTAGGDTSSGVSGVSSTGGTSGASNSNKNSATGGSANSNSKANASANADANASEGKVEETTVAGSVATATTSGKSKGGMQFGKGVYENFNNTVEKMITESITIESKMQECGDGEMAPAITITADGEEAAKLMMLLKLAGLENQIPSACPTCGGSPCGCAEMVDENSPDWPTNTEKLAAEPNLRTYSGGLNGPKSTGQTTVPVVASQLRRQASMEENVELERSLFKTWKNYKG